jgi:FemAB-related protein (PEP-CTERM system-associated)
MLTVDLMKSPDEWDQYVESAAQACNYHRWGWQHAVEKTFGHKPYYLAALEGCSIQGVLPLMYLKSWLFGRQLVSVPFFSYGGVLASSQTASEALVKRATELASDLGVRHIELRQGQAYEINWAETTSKVTMGIPLPKTSEELWKKLSSGMRNKIRSGRKSNFGVQWGGLEDIKPFYEVFAINMRNLGTPVYPRSWFENLYRCRPGDIRVLTLWEGRRPVAGAFLNSFRGTLELPWSVSLPSSRRKQAHVFLYWTFLEWAIEQGYQRMDLGRCTPGGGTYEFKKHWLCEERPLHWYRWTPSGKPIQQPSPSHEQHGLAVRIWKKLPLALANALGPRIVRAIP